MKKRSNQKTDLFKSVSPHLENRCGVFLVFFFDDDSIVRPELQNFCFCRIYKQNFNIFVVQYFYRGYNYDSREAQMFKILVVEDDKSLNRTVCMFLNQCGYASSGALNAADAYDLLYENVFDLIISDVMMPGTDGFAFASNVRAVNENIPILFMTAKDDIASKQRGFRVGADDYMVKPIDLDELVLRVEALLRRAKIATSKRLEVGSFVMDAEEISATLNGEEIPLTVREFHLLYKLLSYPKKTFTRAQLMEEFWNAESETAPRAVDVYMAKLRGKLSGCSDFEIVTVHGLGYKAVLK